MKMTNPAPSPCDPCADGPRARVLASSHGFLLLVGHGEYPACAHAVVGGSGLGRRAAGWPAPAAGVGAGAAGRGVGALAADEGVVAGQSEQPVVAGQAAQGVRAGVAGQVSLPDPPMMFSALRMLALTGLPVVADAVEAGVTGPVWSA